MLKKDFIMDEKELKRILEKLPTKEDLKKTNEKIDKVEKNLSSKIEENSRKIDENSKKIDENRKRIDEVEKNLSSKIDANSKKIDANSERLKRIALQVVENRQAIKKIEENMVTKEEHREVINTLDKMMAILQKIEREQIFTYEWIKRIESDVEKNKKDIKILKEKLNI